MKKISLTLATVLTFFVCIAQQPGPIGWKDVAQWTYMPNNSFVLSPDGVWHTYALVSLEGDGQLIVQKGSDTGTAKKFPIGNTGSIRPEFSKNSQWLAFTVYPTFSEKKANEKAKGKPLNNKVVLLRLSDMDKQTFNNAGRFAFNGDASNHLAVDLVKEGSGSAKGSDMLLIDLSTGKKQNLGNVSGFAFNKAGSYMAYTVDAANQMGNGLHLMKMSDHSTKILDSDEATYQSINWTEKGDAFAALKMVKDKKYKQDHGKLLGVKNPDNPQVVLYDPIKDSAAFPRWYTISPNRQPQWSEDLTRIFYGVHQLEPDEKEKTKSPVNEDSVKAADKDKLAKILQDTSIHTVSDLQKAISKASPDSKAKKDDATKPDMTIWHWQDARLQSRQQVQARQDETRSFWAMYTIASGKHQRLHDSTMLTVSLMPKEHYALASDTRAYDLDQNLNGQSYADYALIDLQNGSSTPLFQNFYRSSFGSSPRSAPDGMKILYGKDGHYYVYDIATKTHTNITEGLPVSFIDTDDDHNVIKPLHNPIGWTSDSRYLWLSDGWDVWQVSASGKEKATNLTVNGRSEKIRYQSRYTLDPEEKGIDTKQPQYMRMYGEWNKKSGIALLSTGKSGMVAGAKPLVWDDANIDNLQKAEKAAVFAYSREKNNVPENIYLADGTLQNPAKATNNATTAGKYAWSAGARLVNYVSDKGDSLQGALFLPAGYEAGRQYPTVVYYYEKLSQTLHDWNNPNYSGTGWNPTMYTSNGYAVFIPDIVYKLDDPGMSAVWCVLPGVKAAIATGVVDAERIGIHGHSWGGYQTSFLITQTNMFKAAAAGAPLTNMISMYDLIYWNSGGGNMSIFEASQGRFRGAPWTNWEAYERNSPVYHVQNVKTPLLLLHNDKDGAVDFTQGVEYYNALRRLKKPVVMVQYKGENHGLSKIENRKDYSVRMMEFFDHYLKGKSAPAWLSEGINRQDLEEHLEDRAF